MAIMTLMIPVALDGQYPMFKKGIISLPVIRIQEIDRHLFYVVEDNEQEWLVRKKDYQNDSEQFIECRYEFQMTKSGVRVSLVQHKKKVIKGLYKLHSVYRFKISQQKPIKSNGGYIYTVEDSFHLKHRLYCNSILAMDTTELDCFVERYDSQKDCLILFIPQTKEHDKSDVESKRDIDLFKEKLNNKKNTFFTPLEKRQLNIAERIKGYAWHKCGKKGICSVCGLEFESNKGYRVEIIDYYLCNSCKSMITAIKQYNSKNKKKSVRAISTPMGGKPGK